MSATFAFLGVAGDRRAYLGLLYALARLPIAFIYLLILATGIPTALGLLPIGVGFAVFVLILGIAWFCAVFERELGRWWFRYEVRPMRVAEPGRRTLLQILRTFVFSPVAWKSLLFMVLEIPLGALAFAVVLALGTISLALLMAPLVYLFDASSVQAGDPANNALGLPDGNITLAVTLLLGATGLVMALLTLHVARGIALGQGALVRALLGMSQAQVDLSAARQEAATQSARAERSEQSRRELVVNVSHELRTPIASIRGHVESLLDPHGGEPSADETRRYLEIVQKETERLGSLVDDLLAVARADAGELQLDIQPTELGPIVQQVAGALAPIARRDRRVTLTAMPENGAGPVFADPDRLNQVLVNLVRNAINYTPEGGIVSIAVREAGPTRVALEVADTGVGIPPDELERIFDRLYRVDASRSRATGGFGLGLAIARDLVQAMGGTIEVASQPGVGSRFTVNLRRA
ncbi:MAG TPA: ATP-binding protein [Candidatus Dormibacteraeota bacterium]